LAWFQTTAVPVYQLGAGALWDREAECSGNNRHFLFSFLVCFLDNKKLLLRPTIERKAGFSETQKDQWGRRKFNRNNGRSDRCEATPALLAATDGFSERIQTT
jgi:hypothetical protein